MRRTTIDIGTNTILLLIAEFNPQNKDLKTILDLQRIPRLGKGVDKNRIIHPKSFEKAVSILKEYSQISNEHGSEKIIATATSFLRDSANKNEFIKYAEEKTGIKIEILSGEDEAKWTFLGGTYDKLKIKNEKLRITTIDIGGGSTEITTGILPAQLSKETINNIIINGRSFDVGSVRVKEKFFSVQPPSEIEFANAGDFIISQFLQFDKSDKSELIGLAGTITTLGAIKLKLDRFIPEKVDNIELSIADVNELLEMFSSKTADELMTLGNYMEGRADIILPGTLILKFFMEKFGFEKLTISTKGLRYGVFLRDVFH